MRQNETERRRPTIARLASGALAGALIGALLTFGNEVLAARFLGVEMYGLYALGMMVARVGEIVCMMGLRVGVLHFIPIYLRDGRHERIAAVVRAALIMPTAAALFYIAAVTLSAPLLERHFGTAAVGYMCMLALAVPFMSLSDVLGNITRAYGVAIYYVLTRNLVPPIVYMSLLVVLLVTQAEPLAITPAFVCAHLAAFAMGMYCVMRVAGPALRTRGASSEYRQLYRYSTPLLVNSLLYVVVSWTGVLVVGMFATPAEVGIYRAAMQITIVFESIAMAFNAAAAHVQPIAIKEGRYADLNRVHHGIQRLATLLSIPAYALIVVNAGDILGLLGEDFRSGAPVMVILGASHLVFCWSASAGFLLVIGAKQTLETTSAGAAAALNVALNVALVPALGYLGAALATCASLVLFALLRVRAARRLMQVKIYDRRLLRTLLLTFCAAASGALLVQLLHIEVFGAAIAIALRSALCASLIAALLWHFDLETDERARVRKFLVAALAARRSGTA